MLTAYSPEQFEEFCRRFLPQAPTWFILGGPANGIEAQECRRLFPSTRIIGCEPCEELRQWQQANGWPTDAPLLPFGLWNTPGTVNLTYLEEKPNSSTMVRSAEGTVRSIPVTTLDTLRDTYGPFPNALLWLDIEGAEWQAIQGASRTLEKDVNYVNVEVMPKELPEAYERIVQTLESYGFKLYGVWNHQGNHMDLAFRK